MPRGYTRRPAVRGIDKAGELCFAFSMVSSLAALATTTCAVGSIAWIAASAISIHRLRALRRLDAIDVPEPERWPALSVVVPARDEGATLEPAVRTLLEQDYPDLEIILVDDRSSDATPAIVDRIASDDGRVRAVHVRSLPDGWLGKVHALHRGLASSSGEWVLFTDADVHFGPRVLRRAIAAALAARLDHLAVAPEVRAPGIWLEAASAAFGGLFLLRTRAHDVGRAGSNAFVGIGAFNLVRREAIERTEGFRWLRMEVLDDVGLGLLLRRTGASAGFAIGVGSLRVEWYPTLGAMARGLEKNLFGGAARYSLGRFVAGTAAAGAFLVAPWLALVPAVPPPVAALAGVAVAGVVAHAAYARAKFGGRLAALLMAPAGAAILAVLLARSASLCLLRGGVEWRGTFHALDELKRGQRVRF